MIAIPPGVRVWLACGRTDMRKGMDGLAMLAQQVLNEDPFGGALFAFRGRRGSARHSAYSFRTARIAYRWHPLFGQTLQVSPHRRGKDLQCIYTDERPDLSRELPTWMFDESYCAGMALGEPQINLGRTTQLAPLWSCSRDLEPVAHDRILQKEGKRRVRRSPYRNPAQLALEHRTSDTPAPVINANPEGAASRALADLLLAAIGTPRRRTIKGG